MCGGPRTHGMLARRQTIEMVYTDERSGDARDADAREARRRGETILAILRVDAARMGDGRRGDRCGRMRAGAARAVCVCGRGVGVGGAAYVRRACWLSDLAARSLVLVPASTCVRGGARGAARRAVALRLSALSAVVLMRHCRAKRVYDVVSCVRSGPVALGPRPLTCDCEPHPRPSQPAWGAWWLCPAARRHPSYRAVPRRLFAPRGPQPNHAHTTMNTAHDVRRA